MKYVDSECKVSYQKLISEIIFISKTTKFYFEITEKVLVFKICWARLDLLRRVSKLMIDCQFYSLYLVFPKISFLLYLLDTR